MSSGSLAKSSVDWVTNSVDVQPGWKRFNKFILSGLVLGPSTVVLEERGLREPRRRRRATTPSSH